MPPAEVAITGELVAALISQQLPEYADRLIVPLSNGWDNAMFRLGDDLIVRLPRRALAADLIVNEQRWLPQLAPRLPLPISAPVAVGVPGLNYPWHWSVVRFHAGATALSSLDHGRSNFDPVHGAEALGQFLRALHEPAPHDAPINPWRGVPLAERDELARQRFHELRDVIDADRSLWTWESALSAVPWTAAPVWLHGDLHPANIVVHDQRVVAVVDWGDITSGDPACDLGAAWMLFHAQHRERFRNAYGNPDPELWARARANALAHAIAVLRNSADNPMMYSIGMSTLHAVLSDTE